MKRTILIILFFLSLCSATAKTDDNRDRLIENLSRMSVQELMKHASEQTDNRHYDTALLYYSTILNKDAAPDNYALIVKVMNRMAAIYGNISDYRSAFSMLMHALELCDRHNLIDEKSSIYNNIGNVYYSCKKYGMASDYYKRALKTNRDTANTFLILNNLVNTGLGSGRTDSVQYWLGKCRDVNNRHGGKYTYLILNSMAFMHKQQSRTDSALHYYRSALLESRKAGSAVTEASVLSSMADLWLTEHKTDLARKYIAMSNDIAGRNNMRNILADNKLLEAGVEEAEGHATTALALYKQHYELRDSIMDTSLLGEITDMQSVYEISKVNRRMEQMEMEHRIKERTIGYQRALMTGGGLLLLLAIGFLVYISASKRKLSRAYKVLMKKNIEIMELEEPKSKTPNTRKSYDANWPADMPQKIKDIMENDKVICDPKFTINRLSELVGTNRTYVSSFINSVEGKNFRTFLNEYRIRAAQRIFAQPDASRYTIETVAAMVGFKSQSSFRDAFKEITGVTPGFYVKSFKAQQS